MASEKKKLNKKQNWRMPVVTKVKLHPEQAVLSCCWAGGRGYRGSYGQCWACFSCPAPGPHLLSS